MHQRRESMPEHTFVHLEFATNNPEEAGNFQAKFFGWKVDIMEEMNYLTYQINNELGGGFLDVNQGGFEINEFIPHGSTADIEASLAKVEGLGWKTLQSKT
jgi:predicted enzyme related to lactoylglutathione lyase